MRKPKERRCYESFHLAYEAILNYARQLRREDRKRDSQYLTLEQAKNAIRAEPLNFKCPTSSDEIIGVLEHFGWLVRATKREGYNPEETEELIIPLGRKRN